MQAGRKFYLIGQNIATSLSPSIHNTLFKTKGRNDHEYGLWTQGVLPELDKLSRGQNFGGMSITIPFKKSYAEQAISKSHSPIEYVGNFASTTKIINTIVKLGQQKLQAHNTDIFGIVKVLQPAKQIKTALILGAGATSQTFCYYLQQSQRCQKIYMKNRTSGKVQAVQERYSKVKPICDYQNENIDLVVNTLPSLALEQGIPDLKKLFKSLSFSQEANFMDVNYRGQYGVVERSIEEQGCRITPFRGINMLIWQAIEQNRLFCQQPEEEEGQQLQYFDMLTKMLGHHKKT